MEKVEKEKVIQDLKTATKLAKQAATMFVNSMNQLSETYSEHRNPNFDTLCNKVNDLHMSVKSLADDVNNFKHELKTGNYQLSLF